MTNGFTARPLPAGKLDYRDEEIQAFGRFMVSNLIAIPRKEEDKTVFIVTWRIRYFWKSDYSKCSSVTFPKNGEISVKISKKDYLNYKDEFSFDQLCANLGDLFIKMFDQFRRGEEVRIMDELNGVKESPFV